MRQGGGGHKHGLLESIRSVLLFGLGGRDRGVLEVSLELRTQRSEASVAVGVVNGGDSVERVKQ